MAAGKREIPQLTRAHRVLVGLVVTGAVIIAGIGFAGSYAAVRELALNKGFGAFSYVFPIGIDAGICVLLALDLLLTWIRIPFPLLRQTAWLLTAATIAFNGAAAWPDPLGVGMHAVIPILFVVAVEAARHAIGRIADITADKHMEGVRFTRWLLSPVPTFLLWRRMKLWELRSYDEIIKLEQERLVYQARLRSRFGRGWRRKAPVEALMPLRLARYGVRLAETAPAGLAAAGIDELPMLFTADRISVPAEHEGSILKATQDQAPEELESGEARSAQVPGTAPERPRALEATAEEDTQRFTEAYRTFITQYQAEPTATQWAFWLRDRYGITTGLGDPLPEEQVQPLLQALRDRYAGHVDEPAATAEPKLADQPADQWYDYFYSAWRTYEHEYGDYPDAAALAAYVYERDAATGDDGQPIKGDDLADFVERFQQREFGSTEPSTEQGAGRPRDQEAGELVQESEAATAGPGAQAGKEKGRRATATIDDSTPGPRDPMGERIALSTVDRYYLAWTEYQTQHGAEPTAEQLSAYLAEKGMHGRGGKPVSPSNLRRYFLPSRVYNVWAEYRMHNAKPAADDVVRECSARGITAQYSKPITTNYITDNAADFERRWQALTRHHTDVKQ